MDWRNDGPDFGTSVRPIDWRLRIGEWQIAIAMKMDPEELEDRLVEFGTAICRLLRRVPKDIVGVHFSRQLVRSATSPAANYAEARGAESRRDFVHKMSICTKELRETSVWLTFVHRLGGTQDETERLIAECRELIAVFVASTNTARKRLSRH